jgi:S-adenosylmethionine decarboxylase
MKNKKEVCNFGLHLMIDGYGGNPEKLNDRKLVTKCLDELPGKTKMNKISKPLVKSFDGNDIKDPGGHSGFVMIAESHISIHTFPKKKFVSIDVYTCNDEMDKDFMIGYFKEKFELEDMEVNFVRRGTRYPIKNMV